MKPVLIANVILNLVQAAALAPALFLEHYSTKKMGVARYLIYKQRVFSETVFTPDIMMIIKVAVAAGLIVLILMLIYFLPRHKNGGSLLTNVFVSVLVNLLAAGFVFSGTGSQLHAYHYFLTGGLVILAAQYIKLILKFYSRA